MASSSLFTASDADDPLSKALQHPPDESPDDRARRIQQQKEAQAISHRIDEDIQESRKAFERRKKAIKILLLGAHTRSPLVARAADPACRTGGIREEHNTQECVSSRVLCAHILIVVLQTSNSRSLHNTFAANALPGVPSSSSTSFGASPRRTQPSVLTGRPNRAQVHQTTTRGSPGRVGRVSATSALRYRRQGQGQGGRNRLGTSIPAQSNGALQHIAAHRPAPAHAHATIAAAAH